MSQVWGFRRDSEGRVVNCPKCKRPMVGWPVKRANLCSPKDWAYCIRIPGRKV